MWVVVLVPLLGLACGQDPWHYCFGAPGFVNNVRPGYALRQVRPTAVRDVGVVNEMTR